MSLDVDANTAEPVDENGPSSRLLVDEPTVGMTTPQAWSLYISHFLSTWNMRTYEFAAIIFTAAAYPDTLTAAGIRGIVRTLASICLSSIIGHWVDHSPNRLTTLTTSISMNRATVILACVLWYFITYANTASSSPTLTFDASLHPAIKHIFFTLILIFGIGENLSGSAATLAMERDWVVVAAGPDGHPFDLTHLNSIMRRIDLICKLISPLLISFIISFTGVQVGVLSVGIMSAVSWGIEIFSARRVWTQNIALQAPKTVLKPSHSESDNYGLMSKASLISRAFKNYIEDFKLYFCTRVYIPSLALSLLHLSALSYSATFITFLLSAGFSLDVITLARAVGSVVEISSTVVTPFGVHLLGKERRNGRFGIGASYDQQRRIRADSEAALLAGGEGDGAAETETEANVLQTVTGLERVGLWGLFWQLLNLLPVLLSISTLSHTLSQQPPSPSSLSTSTIPTAPTQQPSLPPLHIILTLFTPLSLSRLGLWIYDLTTSQLTQTLVASSSRSSFSGVELSFISFFELLQHILVLIFSRPEDFIWVAAAGVCAVGISTLAYAGWVRSERGHLVHLPALHAWGKKRKDRDAGGHERGGVRADESLRG